MSDVVPYGIVLIVLCMDEHIIHSISKYLSNEDIASFAMVNKLTYAYVTHTNVNGHKCGTLHHPFHFTLSLLEHARLEHCMRILYVVKELCEHKIFLHHCAVHINAKQACRDHATKIIIGRHIVINDTVYAYNTCDVPCDFINDIHPTYVRSVERDVNMLRHRMFSIMSHPYTNISYKVVCSKVRDMYKTYADVLDHSVRTNVMRTCFPHYHKKECG